MENVMVDTGDALHAWRVDPGKNTLVIDQCKMSDRQALELFRQRRADTARADRRRGTASRSGDRDAG
jgi:hypothetical protein